MITDYSLPEAMKNMYRTGENRYRNLHIAFLNNFRSNLDKDLRGYVKDSIYTDALLNYQNLNALEKFEVIQTQIQNEYNGKIENKEYQDSSSDNSSSSNSTYEFESETTFSDRELDDD